MGHSKWKKGSW